MKKKQRSASGNQTEDSWALMHAYENSLCSLQVFDDSYGRRTTMNIRYHDISLNTLLSSRCCSPSAVTNPLEAIFCCKYIPEQNYDPPRVVDLVTS